MGASVFLFLCDVFSIFGDFFLSYIFFMFLLVSLFRFFAPFFVHLSTIHLANMMIYSHYLIASLLFSVPLSLFFHARSLILSLLTFSPPYRSPFPFVSRILFLFSVFLSNLPPSCFLFLLSVFLSYLPPSCFLFLFLSALLSCL